MLLLRCYCCRVDSRDLLTHSPILRGESRSHLRRHAFPALLARTALLAFAFGLLLPTPAEARNDVVNCSYLQNTHINYYYGLPYTPDTLIGGKIIYGRGSSSVYTWGNTSGSHITSYCSNCGSW